MSTIKLNAKKYSYIEEISLSIADLQFKQSNGKPFETANIIGAIDPVVNTKLERFNDKDLTR